jgi:1-acyl-sn-glycerol-3-phosphate acyltransferase
VIDDLRKVARGWRWGRPSPQPSSAPVPPLKTEGAFDTDWARKPFANTARDVLQELVMMPAFRYVASPTVRGRERLRHLQQPVIVASNHTSHLDTAAIIEALPLHFRHKLLVGAAADYFFTGKIRGNVAALALGAFPVERKRASAASARLAVRLAQEGWNMILFPEGGRSPDGWLQELKPGAAFVAAKAQRPLVPMWITGTEHLLPRGAKKLRRGKVDVLIGDPLFPEPGEDARTLHVRFERALMRLATEATTDWWTAQRAPDGDAIHGGPEAARWRRVWERGDAPKRARSRWR